MNIYIINSVSFELSNIDELAVTIFSVGFGIVFMSLIAIALFFIYFSKIVVKYENNRIKDSIKEKNNEQKTGASAESDKSDEVFAAIAMAISLYSDKSNNDESLVLTIDINDGLNSQWSSKVQNIANF